MGLNGRRLEPLVAAGPGWARVPGLTPAHPSAGAMAAFPPLLPVVALEAESESEAELEVRCPAACPKLALAGFGGLALVCVSHPLRGWTALLLRTSSTTVPMC
jgi:hypothetical protein